MRRKALIVPIVIFTAFAIWMFPTDDKEPLGKLAKSPTVIPTSSAQIASPLPLHSPKTNVVDTEIPLADVRPEFMNVGANTATSGITAVTSAKTYTSSATSDIDNIETRAITGDPDAAYELARRLIDCAGEMDSDVDAVPGADASNNDCSHLPQQPGPEIVNWLKIASEQGHAAAQYELATLQLVDETTQHALLNSSAVQGYQAAQLALAQHYDDGSRDNLADAYYWYRSAAERGNEVGRVRANELARIMPSDILEEARRRFE